jgi:tetratricopeptide (TPR) repeat protein
LQFNLAAVLTNLGIALSNEESASLHARAAEIFDRLASDAATPQVREFQGNAHTNLGLALHQVNRCQEAVSSLRRAIEIREGLADEVPDIARFRRFVFGAYYNLGWLLATCTTPGVGDPREAVALLSKCVMGVPDSSLYWQSLGVAHYRAGDWQPAIASLDKSADLKSGGDAQDGFYLAMAHWRAGNADDAREWFRRADELMNQRGGENQVIANLRAEAAKLLGLSPG